MTSGGTLLNLFKEYNISETDQQTLSIFFKRYDISEHNQKIFFAYIDTFKDVGKDLSPLTAQANMKLMMHVVKIIPTNLDQLTSADVKKYKRAIENWQRKDGKPISKATKKSHLVGFKQFIRWGVKEFQNQGYYALLDEIPTKIRVQTKEASDMLTEEEIDRIFAAAKEPRDLALISVLVESGCRAGELVSMEIRHVRFTDEFVWLTFPKSKTRTRTIPLKESMTYLASWLSHHPQRGDPNAPLWISINPIPTKKGGSDRVYKPMSGDTVLHLIHRIADRAGIQKRCYTHLFRHTAATNLSKLWTEMQLRQYMGWNPNSSMPAVYCHLGGSALEDATRTRFGMAEEKKPEPKFKKCPRCKRELPKRAAYCDICGTALTQEAKQAHDTVAQELMKLITSDPDLVAKLAAAIQKQ